MSILGCGRRSLAGVVIVALCGCASHQSRVTTATMTSSAGGDVGLMPSDISQMTSQNIVAHLSAGDSLEIALSRLGVDRGQNSAVRAFATRMVSEHSNHMHMGMQLASDNGITPVPAPMDTLDAKMTWRMINRLSPMGNTGNFDRQFMNAEVMMHQHMLNELQMMRPQTSGALQNFVDQTITTVQAHLSDARRVLRDVGGGNNANGNGTP